MASAVSVAPLGGHPLPDPMALDLYETMTRAERREAVRQYYASGPGAAWLLVARPAGNSHPAAAPEASGIAAASGHAGPRAGDPAPRSGPAHRRGASTKDPLKARDGRRPGSLRAPDLPPVCEQGSLSKAKPHVPAPEASSATKANAKPKTPGRKDGWTPSEAKGSAPTPKVLDEEEAADGGRAEVPASERVPAAGAGDPSDTEAEDMDTEEYALEDVFLAMDAAQGRRGRVVAIEDDAELEEADDDEDEEEEVDEDEEEDDEQEAEADDEGGEDDGEEDGEEEVAEEEAAEEEEAEVDDEEDADEDGDDEDGAADDDQLDDEEEDDPGSD
jgi:hypothetical protein